MRTLYIIKVFVFNNSCIGNLSFSKINYCITLKVDNIMNFGFES
ncbi:hypothetical protein BvCmsSINP041_03943 [Escherichia coli]|nr:hypothetical protein BvCmsSINP041_03943 [Escherichia coli]